jgi:hypothetical protein
LRRKVARLPGGKVVLLDIHQLNRVVAGERWIVRLGHKETFDIAEPIDLAREPVLPNTVLLSGFRSAIVTEAELPPPART